jgi:hypothetical protein
MHEPEPQAHDLSPLELVLCMLAVVGGVAAAAYLYWTVHWIAAVVITVYLWILLADVCVTGQQSIIWYLLDFLHHVLSFAGTALVASYLWRLDWRLGTAALVPVFAVLMLTTNFLIVRLYALTPSGRAEHEARRHHPELYEAARR